MFKTWVIWMVMTVNYPDDATIPIALESPARPFFTEKECEIAANAAIDEITKELVKLGATKFGLIAACVPEDRLPGGGTSL